MLRGKRELKEKEVEEEKEEYVLMQSGIIY